MESFRKNGSKKTRERQCDALGERKFIALSLNHAGSQDSERPEAYFLNVLLQFAFYSRVENDESADAPMAETSAKLCAPCW
jgi:hypothetical protein